MWRPFVFAVPAAVVLVMLACHTQPSAPVHTSVVWRRVGAWQGTGTQTLGDVNSETGRFRITWEARDERPAGAGTFRLTVRSAISGRNLEVVVDHRGVGSGVATFADGPRIYDFIVDSSNVAWSFTVEESYDAPVAQ
jgi:hypothetical protein